MPAAPGAFRFLQLGPGEPYTVREDLATARPGRAADRTSLVYFGQLSDFQLADEESPARLEVIDPLSTPLSLPFGAAWRPWEALRAADRRGDDPPDQPVRRGQPGRRRQRRPQRRWTSRSTPATRPTASS